MTTLDLTPRVDCSRGAPMGRNWSTGGDFDILKPLHLNRIPLDSGGYDKGGAYWGHGAPIFVIYDDAGEFMHSMRARSRDAAKAEFREEWPGAFFYGERNPVRIYDNGGETFDRYTAVYLDRSYAANSPYVEARGMDENPFSPGGFGQMTGAQDGPHLGRRIRFDDLPEPCRKLIYQDRA